MDQGLKGMIIGGAVAGLVSGSIVAGAILVTSSGPREVYGDVGVSGTVEVTGPVEVTPYVGLNGRPAPFFDVVIYCPGKSQAFPQPPRPAGCE